MSRLTITDWYGRVGQTWPSFPGGHPLPTEDEAVAAARKLYRFGMGKTFTGEVYVTTGNRVTWVRNGIMYVNPNRMEQGGRGWVALVHDLSHYVHWRRNPDIRPHSAAHARIEIAMIKQVLKRGWMAGTLRKSEKPKADVKDLRYKRILARIKAWESRERRAVTALKKLRKQKSYYERVKP